MIRIITFLPRTRLFLISAWDRILRITSKGMFAECGKNVAFYPRNSDLSYAHIHIGDDVQIGSRACFTASISHIYIGNKVRFAPAVTIRGGNHITDVVGRYMFDFTDKDKRPGDDQDVIIEDDVWVGTNVTILKGVTIGRGCVVAAGAVVNKNTPPYSIVGGVPAKVLKYRFTPDQIKEHESILYGDQRK